MSPLSARVLLTGDHEVAVENSGIDHAVAAYAQHKQFAFAR